LKEGTNAELCMASQAQIKVYVTVFINRRVYIYRVNMRGQLFVNIAYNQQDLLPIHRINIGL
jgi:hypothetical protein